MIEYLGRNMFRGEEIALHAAPVQEFEFTLKIRVECLRALWMAAAQYYVDSIGASDDEIVELIGPLEDPSIEDCLMALSLPVAMPGCTMVDVALDRDSREQLTVSN